MADDESTQADDTNESAAAAPPKPQEIPAGEDTIWAMQTAGIFERQKSHQRAIKIAAGVGVTLFLVVVLDFAGVWTIPGLGGVYNAVGIEDPNKERAVERVEEELTSGNVDPKKREALRKQLLGLQGGNKSSTQGVPDAKHLSQSERELAASIFSDSRKQERKVQLKAPESIQTPSLPDGLTAEAIVKVIGENNRSMGLCIARSAKAGEKLSGRMDVELTIGATGSVQSAVVGSKFAASELGKCAVSTFKRWRFPKFNGEPVTVNVPYVLSAAL